MTLLMDCFDSGKKTYRIIRRSIAVALCILFVLGLAGCGEKSVEAKDLTPGENQVVVYYKNQDAVMPMVISDVDEVRCYYVYDELFQVLAYQHELDRLTPIVFSNLEVTTEPEIGEGIEYVEFRDKRYDTYDPFLQGMKHELRLEFIDEKFPEYLGREATEEESNETLQKLTQKVQLDDLEDRIATCPEAVEYTIYGERDKEVTDKEHELVVDMLEKGYTPDEIVEAIVE